MAAKKTKSKSQNSRRITAAQKDAHRQVTAVILMAVAILLFCFAIIPGENVWTWIHKVILGLFSFSGFILPVLLGFVAVMMALDKYKGSIGIRVWESAFFVVMLNSTVYTFAVNAADYRFFAAVSDAYTEGMKCHGGGVLGVLLGYPMERLFGDVGAKIILILLIVVSFMLITGTTIVSFVRMIRKPVDKTRESIENAIAQTAERYEESRRSDDSSKKSNIDIDLGEGYEKPTRKRGQRSQPEPTANAAPADETAEESSEDKLSAFEKAAAALEEEQPAKESTKPQTAEERAEAAAAMQEQAAQMEAAAQEGAQDEAVYRFPPITLLDNSAEVGALTRDAEAEQRANGQLLVSTLKDFGINTRLSNITYGPAVTRFELEPSAGVKISRITGLADDIALRLATSGVRIEAPIPNKAAVGIEVPNKARKTVGLRSLLDTSDFRAAKGKLTVALGQDIEGRAVLTDLAKMPHLLIAGTTGSGKSVCTNSMIQSVLFRAAPDEVKMILIDPKKVEFGVYNGIPHLLVPVVTDPRKAAGALSWAVNEMLKRYQMFADANVRDISGYNEMARAKGEFKPLPLILIVIDELADLMMAAANEVEDSICRLAQMARAAGMHMVIATQRPSVDVITGLIKANIPSRLALTVASAVDSRTILDAGGAERLLGYGDMLFMPVGQSKPRRVQGCFVTNTEIERVIDFLKNGDKPQEYDPEIIEEINKQAAAAGRAAASGGGEDAGEEEDEALPQAIEIAVEAGQISTSMLQRKMRFGYARAGRIIDQLEQKGIIGPSRGAKPREVLITRQQWIEMSMNSDESAQ